MMDPEAENKEKREIQDHRGNPTGGYKALGGAFRRLPRRWKQDGSFGCKREWRSRSIFWNYPQGGRGRQAQTNAYIILPMKIETSR
ncbi:hypothetical protein Tco_0676622 [Tanacetum coccineum]